MTTDPHPLPANSVALLKPKMFVLVFHAADWEALQEMHAAALQKIPSMTISDTVSAIVTESVRNWKNRK